MEIQTLPEPEQNNQSFSPNPSKQKLAAATKTKEEEKEEEDVEKKQRPHTNGTPPSPSHEFSFTISLCSSKINRHTSPSLAIDLSPADDLFFHGHLLPLQLLSHTTTSSSPRRSTSLDSLPNYQHPIHNNSTNKTRSKPKSFSLTSLKIRWRNGEKGQREEKIKGGFSSSVRKVLQKYLRVVVPLFGGGGGGGREWEEEKRGFCKKQPCNSSASFLGNRIRDGWRGGGPWSSAPGSKRTSPSNSGLLIATSASTIPSSSNDSTMEELQNAIQAAIAHCKNSIAAKEDKYKF